MQLAQRREVPVEERGWDDRAMLWRTLTVDFNHQGFKKGCGGRQLCGDVLETLRCSVDYHGFESSDDVRNDLDEGVVGRQALVPLQPDVDGGRS